MILLINSNYNSPFVMTMVSFTLNYTSQMSGPFHIFAGLGPLNVHSVQRCCLPHWKDNAIKLITKRSSQEAGYQTASVLMHHVRA